MKKLIFIVLFGFLHMDLYAEVDIYAKYNFVKPNEYDSFRLLPSTDKPDTYYFNFLKKKGVDEIWKYGLNLNGVNEAFQQFEQGEKNALMNELERLEQFGIARVYFEFNIGVGSYAEYESRILSQYSHYNYYDNLMCSASIRVLKRELHGEQIKQLREQKSIALNLKDENVAQEISRLINELNTHEILVLANKSKYEEKDKNLNLRNK